MYISVNFRPVSGAECDYWRVAVAATEAPMGVAIDASGAVIVRL